MFFERLYSSKVLALFKFSVLFIYSRESLPAIFEQILCINKLHSIRSLQQKQQWANEPLLQQAAYNSAQKKLSDSKSAEKMVSLNCKSCSNNASNSRTNMHRRRSGWNSGKDTWWVSKVDRCWVEYVWGGVSPLQPTTGPGGASWASPSRV